MHLASVHSTLAAQKLNFSVCRYWDTTSSGLLVLSTRKRFQKYWISYSLSSVFFQITCWRLLPLSCCKAVSNQVLCSPARSYAAAKSRQEARSKKGIACRAMKGNQPRKSWDCCMLAGLSCACTATQSSITTLLALIAKYRLVQPFVKSQFEGLRK